MGYFQSFLFIAINFCIIHISAVGQSPIQDSLQSIESARFESNRQWMKKFGFPIQKDSGQTVFHAAMTLNYSESHEQAHWVAHVIDPLITIGSAKRTNDFREDPDVKSGSAQKEDYLKSGYDRGHLAPAADFRWSARAMSESFFYSNMSPQKPELNRGRWNDLEEVLRKYVEANNRPLYVVTGPVLRKELLKIGPNGVSVPEFYYKVVADLECVPPRGIAFLLPNESCPKMVKDYAVTIDSVEKVTGINFYTAISAQVENQVEAVFVDSLWLTNKKATEPIDLKNLPKDGLNTTMLAGKENLQVTVCGTVLNVKEDTKKNVIYLDIDDKHPNQPFSVEIKPNTEEGLTLEALKPLRNKKFCFRGLLIFDGKKHVMKIDTKAAFFELQTE